jgi:L-arabinokinase
MPGDPEIRHALSACIVLQVDPGTTYLIRQPTAHPIHENWRVELFRQLLSLPKLGLEQLKLLGEIMYQVKSCLNLHG